MHGFGRGTSLKQLISDSGNTYRFNRDAVAVALTGVERSGEEEHGSEAVIAAGAVGSVVVASNDVEEEQLELDFDTDEDV